MDDCKTYRFKGCNRNYYRNYSKGKLNSCLLKVKGRQLFRVLRNIIRLCQVDWSTSGLKSSMESTFGNDYVGKIVMAVADPFSFLDNNIKSKGLSVEMICGL